MKPKTRYNIRLAQKKEVIVRPSSDVDAFYRMMTVTGARDGFGIHSLAYYQKAFLLFHPGGSCELLQAEYAGQPLAALMVFAQGGRAWYFYGASTDQERSRMPTYLLQWEAMLWAKSKGCTRYDLWGVPDHDEDYLENHFNDRQDGLWGVYRFKRGFGGSLVRSAGAFDRVYHKSMYFLYTLYIRLFRRIE
jgi:lipid II:glycine glycyltransferase (peptidoglycan interpeptide bridge formation enzyme)